MSMIIYLEDEEGGKLKELLSKDDIFIEILEGPLASKPFAKFIDPYGDTVFNSLQLPTVISEFKDVVIALKNKEQKQLVLNIIKLMEEALGGVHKYIRFLGD